MVTKYTSKTNTVINVGDLYVDNHLYYGEYKQTFLIIGIYKNQRSRRWRIKVQCIENGKVCTYPAAGFSRSYINVNIVKNAETTCRTI
jgi:hypothetical protein